ncbi:hypothetical protein [Heyndrickxia camelliae]|uniref:hypothetical protein n=1 Tax=Heyndrickxia camelliae TaxID=1707093 RepID=UPI001303C780|nr:hypothetical protein [Heyndrickxia camelliae]
MNTFQEKRKARRDKRKKAGKDSMWWDLLDLFFDLAELLGPSLVRSVRAAFKFLEHH